MSKRHLQQPPYMLALGEQRLPGAHELGLEDSFLPPVCAPSQEMCSTLGLRDAKGTVQPSGGQCPVFTGDSAVRSVTHGLRAERPADNLVERQLSSAEIRKNTSDVASLKTGLSVT